MTDKKHRTASPTDRRPDCVTETRMGIRYNKLRKLKKA